MSTISIVIIRKVVCGATLAGLVCLQFSIASQTAASDPPETPTTTQQTGMTGTFGEARASSPTSGQNAARLSTGESAAQATVYPVTIYQNINYGGPACSIIGAGWVDVCPGFDNTASSIGVLAGWSTRVWADSFLGGASRCFTSSVPDLSGLQFNENGSGDINDAISSFASYPQDHCPPLGSNWPDLYVKSFYVGPEDAYTNDDIHMGIGIRNLNATVSPEFWIGLYIDRTWTSCSDLGDYQLWADGLAGNTTEMWPLIIPAGTLSVGSHQVYAYADNACEVDETNELNNSAYLFTLDISDPPVPPPSNDEIGAAETVTEIRYTDSLDTRGATRAPSDPEVVACGIAPGRASVWYQYAPTVDTAVSLDTLGSDYDTYIAVWSDTGSGLAEVACNNDASSTVQQSSLQVNLEGGTTYYIEVAHYSDPINIIGWGNHAGGSLVFHAVFAAEAGSWYGSAVITSDYNVVAVGRPHIGSEVASYGGFTGGSTTQYVPMLFKQMWGSYDSALYVQNINPDHETAVTIEFYDSSGSLSCTKTDTIAAQSSKGYWLPAEACLPASWVGGTVITSTFDIVAVGRPHIGSQVMTYNGFAGGAASMYVPMLFKNMWGYDAAFYVQNIDPDFAADLTIQFYDTEGSLSCEMSDSLPSLASKGYWLPALSCLGSSWVGGAVVSSSTDIVAVGRPHLGSEVTTYNGFASGATSMVAPMLFKQAFSSTYNAALYVQNVHPTDSASFTLKFYDTSGSLSCSLPDSLAHSASRGYWLPALTCLPAGWVGSVQIESDLPVVAIARPHLGSVITAYDAMASGGMGVSVPMLFKQMWGSYNSALYIQNTDPANTASVTLKFYDVNGYLSCVRNESLLPLNTRSYWLPSLTCSP